jgi:hypothetical protein
VASAAAASCLCCHTCCCCPRCHPCMLLLTKSAAAIGSCCCPFRSQCRPTSPSYCCPWKSSPLRESCATQSPHMHVVAAWARYRGREHRSMGGFSVDEDTTTVWRRMAMGRHPTSTRCTTWARYHGGEHLQDGVNKGVASTWCGLGKPSGCHGEGVGSGVAIDGVISGHAIERREAVGRGKWGGSQVGRSKG